MYHNFKILGAPYTILQQDENKKRTLTLTAGKDSLKCQCAGTRESAHRCLQECNPIMELLQANRTKITRVEAMHLCATFRLKEKKC